MNRFAHLAQHLFNVPLAIHPRKAELLAAVLAQRIGLTRIEFDGRSMPTSPLAMDDDEEGFSGPGRSEPSAYEMLGPVAVIEISGTLVHRLGTLRPYSGMTGYDGIRQNFLQAMSDPAVLAVAFQLDSPGGEVCGCLDLVDAIYQARGGKPIWAILGEHAYSAAYAIASAADQITVPRTGGGGSIGTVAMHVDWSQALSEAGLKITFLQHGARKTEGAPELPLSAEAAKRFQADIDEMGVLLDATVARNRGLDVAVVAGFEATTFMGEQLVKAGLADAVLPPDAAFRALLSSL